MLRRGHLNRINFTQQKRCNVIARAQESRSLRSNRAQHDEYYGRVEVRENCEVRAFTSDFGVRATADGRFTHGATDEFVVRRLDESKWSASYPRFDHPAGAIHFSDNYIIISTYHLFHFSIIHRSVTSIEGICVKFDRHRSNKPFQLHYISPRTLYFSFLFLYSTLKYVYYFLNIIISNIPLFLSFSLLFVSILLILLWDQWYAIAKNGAHIPKQIARVNMKFFYRIRPNITLIILILLIDSLRYSLSIVL